MRHNAQRSAGRRGFTLVEVGVAIFIVTVVALAGFAYYGTARVTEINEWHEQNALFNCEREVEAWQEEGYTALGGFTGTEVAPNYLPYGYRWGSADASWNVAGRYKQIVLDGFTYRVRAQNNFNASTAGNDYYVEDTWSGISYRYREIVVTTQWGGFSGFTSTFDMQQTTRMAR